MVSMQDWKLVVQPNTHKKKKHAIVYGKVHMSFSAFSRELLRNGYVANEDEGLQCL